MKNEFNNIEHKFKNKDVKFDFRFVIYVTYLTAGSHADDLTNA